MLDQVLLFSVPLEIQILRSLLLFIMLSDLTNDEEKYLRELFAPCFKCSLSPLDFFYLTQ